MPRSVDPFAFTNWETAPILRDLLNDVQDHVNDAMHGNRANKVVIAPACDELAESCVSTLKELGMSDMDLLRVLNNVYEGHTVPTHA